MPRLQGIRKSGAGFAARCPAHDDTHASLMVATGRDHPVVFKCHAGCEQDAVLAALGLTWPELSLPPTGTPVTAGEWTPAGPATAVYDYRDEHGTLLYQVLRTATKEFRQRIPDPSAKSGWTWKLGEVRRVIYRLQEVIQAVREGRRIWITEGEKDVHSFEKHGEVATCNSGGAGKWLPTYVDFFREANVTIVADKDSPGQAHARHVAAELTDVVQTIRTVESVTGKDATDHFTAGHTVDEFVETWNSHAPWQDDPSDPDLWEFIRTGDDAYDWVVPNLLERGDRLMLTGFEGLGKAC